MALGFAGGCSDDVTDPDPICIFIEDPQECEDAEETGETGEADADAEPLEPCTAGGDGPPLTVFQCDGSLSVSFAFDTFLGDCAATLGDADWCEEEHDFGAEFEPYDPPAVMACCDPETAPDDDILRHCGADLVEQVCRTIPKRLRKLIDDDVIELGEKQAKKLIKWFNDHQQDCYNTFNKPGDTPGVIEPTSWLVNNGANDEWPLLEDLTVTLESAVVTSATLPADEDEHASCTDLRYNNTEIFEEEVPVTPGIDTITFLAEATDVVEIAGPELFGSRVSGAGELASRATLCEQPRCSFMALSEDPMARLWTLEELELYGEHELSLSNGTLSASVQRPALRLYGLSHGQILSPDDHDAFTYVIQAGDAHFLVSGESGGIPDLRWSSNSSPILAHETADGGWAVDGFTVEHLDGAGQRWTLTVPPTIWD